MGNTGSSSGRHQDDSVDYGQLTPQGVYTGPKDYNQTIVAQLICDRKLAPFYRPLEEYDEKWDDDQILAARKELPDAAENGNGHGPAESAPTPTLRAHEAGSGGSRPSRHTRTSIKDGPARCPEATVYRGAAECPICFLYYPPNINRTRCCDQEICTECFVQIKRAEPTTTHLVSEPAACPYCMQDNFGVVYKPPLWRAGIGSDGGWPDSPKASSNDTPSAPTHKRRQKSFGHDSPEVVTTDQIRPDWEQKLAAVRAAVTRRANRRIIMRQVGDRLIPVGVTSGRVHALPTEDGQIPDGTEAPGNSRRSRRRQQQQGTADLNQYLGSMGLGGQDLEELMVMEAMRLSLMEHEEQQKREAEKKKKEAAGNGDAGGTTDDSGAGPSTAVASSLPGTSRTQEAPPSPRARSLTPGSRAPIPAPVDVAQANAQQASNPQPFSTLGAALSTASTASAILGQPGGSPGLPSPSPGPHGVRESIDQGCSRSPPASYSTLSAALSTASTASAILGQDRAENSQASLTGPTPPAVTAAAVIDLSETPGEERLDGSPAAAASSHSSIPATSAPEASKRPPAPLSAGEHVPTRAERSASIASSLVNLAPEINAYDVLVSSPESSVSRAPLIHGEMEHEMESAPGAAGPAPVTPTASQKPHEE